MISPLTTAEYLGKGIDSSPEGVFGVVLDDNAVEVEINPASADFYG